MGRGKNHGGREGGGGTLRASRGKTVEEEEEEGEGTGDEPLPDAVSSSWRGRWGCRCPGSGPGPSRSRRGAAPGAPRVRPQGKRRRAGGARGWKRAIKGMLGKKKIIKY